MGDEEIIALFLARQESAIEETTLKYGRYGQTIAMNVLRNQEDVSECMNDAYLRLWNSIPPNIPTSFIAYFGKIIRNLSLDYYQKKKAKKRCIEMLQLLDELEECLPARDNVEDEILRKELGKEISTWLKGQNVEKRDLFLQRYWYGYSIEVLAKYRKVSKNKIAMQLFRLRKGLKVHLEREEWML